MGGICPELSERTLSTAIGKIIHAVVFVVVLVVVVSVVAVDGDDDHDHDDCDHHSGNDYDHDNDGNKFLETKLKMISFLFNLIVYHFFLIWR